MKNNEPAWSAANDDFCVVVLYVRSSLIAATSCYAQDNPEQPRRMGGSGGPIELSPMMWPHIQLRQKDSKPDERISYAVS
ncbi:MAG: hypothetical protein U0930_07415 [Pirellulales bacterium]